LTRPTLSAKRRSTATWVDDQTGIQDPSLFSNISQSQKKLGIRDVSIHIPKNKIFVKTLENPTEFMKRKKESDTSTQEWEKYREVAFFLWHGRRLVKVLYEWFSEWEKLSSNIQALLKRIRGRRVVESLKAAGASFFGRRGVGVWQRNRVGATLYTIRGLDDY
jgi:hypothetical protein